MGSWITEQIAAAKNKLPLWSYDAGFDLIRESNPFLLCRVNHVCVLVLIEASDLMEYD